MYNAVLQKHSALTEQQLNHIAELKDQHWPHGLESQKAWIARNFEQDDHHLILYCEDRPVAYASLNYIQCTVDSLRETVLGLGSVCVDKASQRQGLGKKIVEYVNQYIAAAQLPGLLLCHQPLTTFYAGCGWKLVNSKQTTVAGAAFSYFVMSFGKTYGNVNKLVIPKNF